MRRTEHSGARALWLGLGLLAALPPAQARAQAAPQTSQGATMIRRGERVSLSARIGLVVASIEVEALQDGQRDEVIRVRSLQTGRVHRARVLDPGRVEVQP